MRTQRNLTITPGVTMDRHRDLLGAVMLRVDGQSHDLTLQTYLTLDEALELAAELDAVIQQASVGRVAA